MKNGSYYGIDFGTTNTSVFLYNYEQGRGTREAGYGTDGKDLTPFSSCIAISKTVKNDFRFGREVKENINQYADDYQIITSFKSLLGTDQEITVNGVGYTGTRLAALFLKYPESVKPDCFKMFEPRMKSSASGIFSYMIFCTHLVQIQTLELLIKILRLSAL